MAHVANAQKRWDSDDRFTGVADASAFAHAIEELAELARRPRWVAEDPQIHLAPHLRGAGVEGLRIAEIRTVRDGVLSVTAEYDHEASRGELRRLAWALLGTIAEPAASVRERHDDDAAVYEVVTGIPANTGPFASHGHTIRLTLTPTARSGGSATQRSDGPD